MKLFENKLKQANAEYQAGAALVDEGIDFDVPGVFQKKITLTIKPQKPGSIVRISMLITKLEQIEEGSIQEFLLKGKNLKIIAAIIATAIINTEFFKMWKYRWYYWLMLKRVKDLAHLYSYFLLVQRQMGGQFFFLIMALTPAMNYLMKQEKQKAKPGGEKASGEPLP